MAGINDFFSETFNGFESLKKIVESMANTSVYVGVPEAETDRDDENSDITNAALAYIHDTGAPEAGIPARPFMTEGIRDAQKEISERLEKAAKASLDGNQAQATRQYNAAGIIAQKSIQNKITDGDFTPLAASTLASRRRRKRKGTKPLLDSGALRQSITYTVE